jgi:hypothetical protein
MTNRSKQQPWVWFGCLAGVALGCVSLEPLSSYSDRSPAAPQPRSAAVDALPAAEDLALAPLTEQPVDVDEGPPADGELALEPVEPPAPEADPTPTCGAPGEFLAPGGAACYLRSAQNAVWADALASCQAWGGGLVVIDSREEDAFLSEHLDVSFWIGASDRIQEGRVLWNGGAPLVFSNWAAGQPDDYQGREDCVVKTMPVGSWNDLPCRNLNAYVCERGPT